MSRFCEEIFKPNNPLSTLHQLLGAFTKWTGVTVGTTAPTLAACFGDAVPDRVNSLLGNREGNHGLLSLTFGQAVRAVARIGLSHSSAAEKKNDVHQCLRLLLQSIVVVLLLRHAVPGEGEHGDGFQYLLESSLQQGAAQFVASQTERAERSAEAGQRLGLENVSAVWATISVALGVWRQHQLVLPEEHSLQSLAALYSDELATDHNQPVIPASASDTCWLPLASILTCRTGRTPSLPDAIMCVFSLMLMGQLGELEACRLSWGDDDQSVIYICNGGHRCTAMAILAACNADRVHWMWHEVGQLPAEACLEDNVLWIEPAMVALRCSSRKYHASVPRHLPISHAIATAQAEFNSKVNLAAQQLEAIARQQSVCDQCIDYVQGCVYVPTQKPGFLIENVSSTALQKLLQFIGLQSRLCHEMALFSSFVKSRARDENKLCEAIEVCTHECVIEVLQAVTLQEFHAACLGLCLKAGCGTQEEPSGQTHMWAAYPSSSVLTHAQCSSRDILQNPFWFGRLSDSQCDHGLATQVMWVLQKWVQALLSPNEVDSLFDRTQHENQRFVAVILHFQKAMVHHNPSLRCHSLLMLTLSALDDIMQSLFLQVKAPLRSAAREDSAASSVSPAKRKQKSSALPSSPFASFSSSLPAPASLAASRAFQRGFVNVLLQLGEVPSAMQQFVRNKFLPSGQRGIPQARRIGLQATLTGVYMFCATQLSVRFWQGLQATAHMTSGIHGLCDTLLQRVERTIQGDAHAVELVRAAKSHLVNQLPVVKASSVNSAFVDGFMTLFRRTTALMESHRTVRYLPSFQLTTGDMSKLVEGLDPEFHILVKDLVLPLLVSTLLITGSRRSGSTAETSKPHFELLFTTVAQFAAMLTEITIAAVGDTAVELDAHAQAATPEHATTALERVLSAKNELQNRFEGALRAWVKKFKGHARVDEEQPNMGRLRIDDDQACVPGANLRALLQSLHLQADKDTSLTEDERNQWDDQFAALILQSIRSLARWHLKACLGQVASVTTTITAMVCRRVSNTFSVSSDAIVEAAESAVPRVPSPPAHPSSASARESGPKCWSSGVESGESHPPALRSGATRIPRKKMVTRPDIYPFAAVTVSGESNAGIQLNIANIVTLPMFAAAFRVWEQQWSDNDGLVAKFVKKVLRQDASDAAADAFDEGGILAEYAKAHCVTDIPLADIQLAVQSYACEANEATAPLAKTAEQRKYQTAVREALVAIASSTGHAEQNEVLVLNISLPRILHPASIRDFVSQEQQTARAVKKSRHSNAPVSYEGLTSSISSGAGPFSPQFAEGITHVAHTWIPSPATTHGYPFLHDLQALALDPLMLSEVISSLLLHEPRIVDYVTTQLPGIGTLPNSEPAFIVQRRLQQHEQLWCAVIPARSQVLFTTASENKKLSAFVPSTHWAWHQSATNEDTMFGAEVTGGDSAIGMAYVLVAGRSDITKGPVANNESFFGMLRQYLSSSGERGWKCHADQSQAVSFFGTRLWHQDASPLRRGINLWSSYQTVFTCNNHFLPATMIAAVFSTLKASNEARVIDAGWTDGIVNVAATMAGCKCFEAVWHSPACICIDTMQCAFSGAVSQSFLNNLTATVGGIASAARAAHAMSESDEHETDEEDIARPSATETIKRLCDSTASLVALITTESDELIQEAMHTLLKGVDAE